MSDEVTSAKKGMSLALKEKILIICLVLTYCAIWGQSCMNRTDSRAESNAVLSVLEPISGVDVSTDNISDAYGRWDQLVRKSAHVIEYMVLGVELALLVFFETKRKGVLGKKHYFQLQFNILMLGLLTAVIDETIQLFSHRGSLVEDIWVDMLGIVLGIAVVMLCTWKKCFVKNGES